VQSHAGALSGECGESAQQCDALVGAEQHVGGWPVLEDADDGAASAANESSRRVEELKATTMGHVAFASKLVNGPGRSLSHLIRCTFQRGDDRTRTHEPTTPCLQIRPTRTSANTDERLRQVRGTNPNTYARARTAAGVTVFTARRRRHP
jgi:hypothetical protein